MTSPTDEWKRITQFKTLTLKTSLLLDLPKREWLLPNLIPASDTVAVVAQKEIDAQGLALLIAYCISAGKGFAPFGVGAGVPVLFCNGYGDQQADISLLKMISQRDPSERARERASENLHIYHREFESDPPFHIDTYEGQAALRRSLPKGCKLVIFDAAAAWFCGAKWDPLESAKVKPWLRALNREGVAVLIFESDLKKVSITSGMIRKPSNYIYLTPDPAAPTEFGGGFNIVRKKTSTSDKIPSTIQFWYKVVDGKFDFGWEFRDVADAATAKQVAILQRQMQVETLLLGNMEQKEIAEELRVHAATISRDVCALRERKNAANVSNKSPPARGVTLTRGGDFSMDDFDS
jgi:hypothetical protein